VKKKKLRKLLEIADEGWKAAEDSRDRGWKEYRALFDRCYAAKQVLTAEERTDHIKQQREARIMFGSFDTLEPANKGLDYYLKQNLVTVGAPVEASFDSGL